MTLFKSFTFSLALLFHFAVIALLLQDRVQLPINGMGHSVIVKILQQENSAIERVPFASPNLAKPLVTIDQPQLELPLGQPVPQQPMVVTGVRFAPNVVLVVPPSEYSRFLSKIASVYNAEVSVLVSSNGAVGNLYIEKSDKNRELDAFIISYAQAHWRFIPSLSDGVAVASWKVVRVKITAKEMILTL